MSMVDGASGAVDRHAAVHLSGLQGSKLALVGFWRQNWQGRFRFELVETGALMGKYWAFFGWAFLVVTIASLFVGALSVAAAFGISGGDFDSEGLAEFLDSHVYLIYAFTILNYLVVALAISIFLRIYLVRGVWERIVSSTTVHDLEAADNVVAKGGLANALGEGFANDLDIGGF